MDATENLTAPAPAAPAKGRKPRTPCPVVDPAIAEANAAKERKAAKHAAYVAARDRLAGDAALRSAWKLVNATPAERKATASSPKDAARDLANARVVVMLALGDAITVGEGIRVPAFAADGWNAPMPLERAIRSVFGALPAQDRTLRFGPLA